MKGRSDRVTEGQSMRIRTHIVHILGDIYQSKRGFELFLRIMRDPKRSFDRALRRRRRQADVDNEQEFDWTETQSEPI